ncbi:MAG: M24 family metallopeptidase [Candidatus Thorarchaeota archaeon]
MLAETVYHKRMEKVRDTLDRAKADFAIITPSPGYQYLTGANYQMKERLVAMIIPRKGDSQIIAPSFEVSDQKRHTWIKDYVPWSEDEDPYSVLANTMDSKGGEFSIMFDNDMPLGVYWSIEKALGGFKGTSTISPLLNEMRLIKSDEEIDLMKRAGRIIDDVFQSTFSKIQIGMTETEISQIVNVEVTQRDAVPTFAVVLFAENSALPHADSGSSVLKKGDQILMDCGCSLDGYNTDMTRNAVVGDPSDEYERVHSLLIHAQETAIEKIRPGLACGAADGIARKIIEEDGYGEYFTHRLGHGIGIQIHEHPYLVRGNSLELRPGMTFSVEPGIYQEGKFGIRMEDLVCVGEDGAELLTFASKEIARVES